MRRETDTTIPPDPNCQSPGLKWPRMNTMAIQATMNPHRTYFGRSELSEGLQALFRPMAIIAPQTLRIVEVTLMARRTSVAR